MSNLKSRTFKMCNLTTECVPIGKESKLEAFRIPKTLNDTKNLVETAREPSLWSFHELRHHSALQFYQENNKKTGVEETAEAEPHVLMQPCVFTQN